MRNTAIKCLVACVITIMAGPALADSQEVSAKVTLNNFSNSNIEIGIRTSDLGAAFHSCTTGSKPSCTVTDDQSSIPKNIGNILCMPSAMNVSIDSSCQSLLDAGESESCQSNSASGYCYGNVVMPACNYRTEDDKSTAASWTWTLSPGSNGVIDLACSQSGYQGYTQ
ncbi:hypothetical protein [Breoghania sp. L-A4]|uniref:hypothetical protein n=1 Tax=Breoghania sp. L-A4 TaxID=2304600 RepID=UPI000E35DFC9|nr:hypothetical protein [Breoghania sp. L-A4]AXS41804.1 hypothetical protein D1F64_19595 [Breoghania sp. L-A4]